MIYVVSTSDRACVKIGYSKKRPIERCGDLEAAHPEQLVLLLVLRGDKSVERYFHNRFEALRIPSRREWFQKGREIEEWLRSEEGIITRSFYDWLTMRSGDENQIGDFARGALQADDFPRASKSYFVVEDYLRARGSSLETRVLFDRAWREFLRDAVRVELVTNPIVEASTIGRLERSADVRPKRVVKVHPEVEAAQLERVVDLFDRLLPEALLKNPDRAQAIDTILCFKIEGAGDWTIDCSKETSLPSCARSVSNSVRCSVELGVDAFVLMLSDPNAGMRLYFQKRLIISGDLAQVSKIATVFELALVHSREDRSEAMDNDEALRLAREVMTSHAETLRKLAK